MGLTAIYLLGSIILMTKTAVKSLVFFVVILLLVFLLPGRVLGGSYFFG